MKKKSIVARVGVVAAALTLATTSLMSGTLARYTTEASTTAKAVVASWGAEFKSGSTALTSSTILYLGDSGLVDMGAVAGMVGKDTTATDAAGKSVYKLAPGMKGSIPLTIDMKNADVDALCTIDIASVDTDVTIPANMKFSYTYTDTSGTPKSVPITLAPGGLANDVVKKIISKGSTDTDAQLNAALTWEWPLDAGASNADADAIKAANIAETEALKTDTPDIRIAITMTARQADATDTSPAGPSA